MKILNLVRDLFLSSPHSSGQARRQKRSVRLQVEQLETRVVPVVGATAIPVSVGHGFDEATNQMSQYDGAYSGVVYLLSYHWGGAGYTLTDQGTGSLLFGGQNILTAAHLFTDIHGNYDLKHDYTLVVMETATGAASMRIPASNYNIHPKYDGNWEHGSDLAMLTIPKGANNVPYGTSLYDIYADTNEIGQTFNLVGYGNTGVGAQGEQQQTSGHKRVGQNQFDVTSDGILTHTPNGLAYGFDSGKASDSYLGRLTGAVTFGLGANEAFAGHGDSGGPVFVGGAIAGVVSFGYHDFTNPVSDNNGFGAVGVVTRLSAPSNADWINGFIGSSVHRTSGRSYTLDLRAFGGNPATVEVRPSATTVDFYVNGKDIHSEYLWGLNTITIKGGADTTKYSVPTRLWSRTTVDGTPFGLLFVESKFVTLNGGSQAALLQGALGTTSKAAVLGTASQVVVRADSQLALASNVAWQEILGTPRLSLKKGAGNNTYLPGASSTSVGTLVSDNQVTENPVDSLIQKVSQIADQQQVLQTQIADLQSQQADSEALVASLQRNQDQASTDLPAALANIQTYAAQIDDLDQTQIPLAQQAVTDADTFRAAAQANLDQAQGALDAALQDSQATPLDLNKAALDLKSAQDAFGAADQTCQESAQNLASLQEARKMADDNRQAAVQLATDLQSGMDKNVANLDQLQQQAADIQTVLATAQGDLDASAVALNQAYQDQQVILALTPSAMMADAALYSLATAI